MNRTIIACDVTSIYQGEFFLRNNLMHCRYEHRLDLVNSRTRLEADTDIRFCLAQKDLGTKGSKIQNASKLSKLRTSYAYYCSLATRTTECESESAQNMSHIKLIIFE